MSQHEKRRTEVAGVRAAPERSHAPVCVLALAVSITACAPSVDARVEPIIGGSPDATDNWVVGIDIGGAAVCSGTLITPSLVLTARHCVSSTPEMIDCTPTGIDTQKVLSNFPASTFRVTTGSDLSGGGPWWSVRTVYYVDDATCATPATACRLCGYDLALLELAPNASGLPTHFVAPSALPPVRGAPGTAIGFGCQSVPDATGACSPLGLRSTLESVSVLDVTANDLTADGRVCGGDSGGPLYSRPAALVYGALSRGDPGCTTGIYTRTDPHFAWLEQYASLAAIHGGYARPAWIRGGTDAGVSPGASLGEPCSAPGDCASGLCIAVDGQMSCSQRCAATAPCPIPYVCTAGYCLAPADGGVDAHMSSDATVATDAGAGDLALVGSCACHAGVRRGSLASMLALGSLVLGLVCRTRRTPWRRSLNASGSADR